MAENNPSPPLPPPPPSSCKPPPTITLPPRNSIHNLFTGGGVSSGVSPGPMSLVSSFFSENDPDNDCQSFSQLLSGAMSSPRAPCDVRHDFPSGGAAGGSEDFMFQQNRGAAAGMFTMPSGLNQASLMQYPGMFPSSQGLTSHQPNLSQITSQTQQHQPHAQQQLQSEYTSLSKAMHQPIQDQGMTGSSDMPFSDKKSQPLNFAVDKPADDGYNWRKYGQKQVKGSEFPRSYYKCTYSNCPVKKKVERSLDGQITEIIYKGQHNHPTPNNKRGKESGNSNGAANGHAHGNALHEGSSGTLNILKEESSQVTPEHASGSSDSEEVGNTVETRVDGRDEDEPESKRRNVEVPSTEHGSNHRTVTEPRIIVQTTSEVDLLDDGYRWRKYGQKVVKGNPHPRSYYKCTSTGCNVRKHIERAASDPKAVITTYEGKHNHDVPTAKSSSHNTAMMQLRPQVERPLTNVRTEFEKNKQQPPVALLRFKEEQNMAFL